MKPGIHPKYHDVEVRCACGNTFKTHSTKPELHLEICNACHPFFTGRQKLIDTEGRVERFTKRFGAQIDRGAARRQATANKAAKTAQGARRPARARRSRRDEARLEAVGERRPSQRVGLQQLRLVPAVSDRFVRAGARRSLPRAAGGVGLQTLGVALARAARSRARCS